MIKFLITYLLCLNLNYGNGANILGLMGVASPSHHIWNSALLHELANRGHNLTILSVDLPKTVLDNVHYIHLEEVYNSLASNNPNLKLNINDYIESGPLRGIPLYYEFGLKVMAGVLMSKGFDVLLNYSDSFKFDLIIHDFTCGPYLIGFAHKFKYPPIIGISAFLYPPVTRDQVGGHFYPAYIPHYETTYDTDMNFIQRMYSNFLYLFDMLYRLNISKPKIDKIMRNKFSSDMPYLGDIEKKTVIALVNSHPAVTYPESMPPNVIEVGGMQIKEPKPLANDLESFINNSRKGAILFSLGTNVHGIDIAEDKIYSIISAMEQLPEYNFLWKMEENCINKNLPKNILIRPFLPQSDILAHPKVMAFVSHGGGLSTHEATWRGVPIIGIPLFMDQIRNLHKSVLAGVAEQIKFSEINAINLRDIIKKVVENKIYTQNIKLRSTRFRDRPMKPLDTAVWWVEYVLRHPEPLHLRSPTLNMNVLTANSLDFIFILIIALLVIVYMIINLFYKLKKHFGSNHGTSKMKKDLYLKKEN